MAGSQRSGLTVWSCGSLQASLIHHSGDLRRLVSTFFPGRQCPHICKGIHWWQINRSLTHCGKDAATTSPLVSRVSIHGHFFVSMATRLSNLDEQKPRTNSQKEGHTLTPPSSQNGPEDPEVFGGTPSWSPSQSPVRKPDHLGTWYCLEIHVISTKDDKVIPPHHTHGRPKLWKTWFRKVELA